jgi:hypothetical protein
MARMQIAINGLPLPAAVATAIEAGTWLAPEDTHLWYALVPPSEVGRPKLYKIELMRQVNADWANESDPIYLGLADGRRQPGNLDPRLSLLIGELDPDGLIALDYRSSIESPSVAYLMLTGDSCRWMQISPDIDTFMRLLSLVPKEAKTPKG